MAPKKGGGGVEKVEAKQALTAVLLADSFTQVRIAAIVFDHNVFIALKLL
jgi:hypothetical protein